MDKIKTFPKNTWAWLDGKKTYFIAAIGVLFALSQVWSGAITWQEAIELVLPLLGLGSVRYSIK